MQSIEASDLEELDRKLEALLKEAPKLRKKLHNELGEMALNELKGQIPQSGVNDSHGTVRGWQKKKPGSGGGYVVIRPKDKPTGPNGPGAITNYLNSGHRTRPPSYRSKRYRRRVTTKSFIDGKEFYQTVLPSIERKAIQMGQDFADKLAKKLGG